MRLKIISGLLGILLCSAPLISVCTGADCGCGSFDTTPSGYGWDSPGNSGIDTYDTSQWSASPGSGSAGPSDSGSSSSGSSATGSTSQTSGSSVSGDSGSGSAGAGGGSSDDAVLLASTGLNLFRKGDFNNSLVALNGSLSRDPFTTKTWMLKGDVLAAMGRYEEAIAVYTQVIRLDPGDPGAYAKRGDAQVNMGKFNEAVVSYDRALAANPGLSAVQTNRTRAVELASGLINTNLTPTEPTVAITATMQPPSNITTTSPPMTATSPVSTTKAPLSLLVLLMVIPLTGIVSIIFNRRK